MAAQGGSIKAAPNSARKDIVEANRRAIRNASEINNLSK